MTRPAAISKVEIERRANQARVIVNTAKPGIIIGKRGVGIDEIRKNLEKLTGKTVQVNVMEIKHPELDARLVAQNIVDQLEKRIAFRRAMKQGIMRTMKAGARGVKVQVRAASAARKSRAPSATTTVRCRCTRCAPTSTTRTSKRSRPSAASASKSGSIAAKCCRISRAANAWRPRRRPRRFRENRRERAADAAAAAAPIVRRVRDGGLTPARDARRAADGQSVESIITRAVAKPASTQPPSTAERRRKMPRPSTVTASRPKRRSSNRASKPRSIANARGAPMRIPQPAERRRSVPRGGE